jgi:hypothetical protein
MALMYITADTVPRPRSTSSPLRAIAIGVVFAALLMVRDVKATATPTSTPTSAPTTYDNGISSETEAIIFGVMAAVILISLCYFGFDKRHAKVHHHDAKDDLPHVIPPSSKEDSASDSDSDNDSDSDSDSDADNGNEGAAADEPRPAEESPSKAAVTLMGNNKAVHPSREGGAPSLGSVQEV